MDTLSIKRNSIESIKQFLIWDVDLLKMLNNYFHMQNIPSVQYCNDILLPSAKQKMKILGGDPLETQEARTLMFGHHIANSLEAASDFAIPHDIAVSMGIIIEMDYIKEQRNFQNTDYGLFLDTIAQLNLTSKNARIYFSGNERDAKERFRVAMRNSKLLSPDGRYLIRNLESIGKPNNNTKYIDVCLDSVIKKSWEYIWT
jgi:3-dehydroquinate synthetase